jgi:hypothetical protein
VDQEGKRKSEMSKPQCIRTLVAFFRSVKKWTKKKTKNNQAKMKRGRERNVRNNNATGWICKKGRRTVVVRVST